MECKCKHIMHEVMNIKNTIDDTTNLIIGTYYRCSKCQRIYYANHINNAKSFWLEPPQIKNN